MFNLPRNVLKFAVNACIDSLPTYSNLSRWGNRLSNKCPFCPNTTGTLHHILAHCPSLLERYTWRHNNVLKAILTTITTTGTGNVNVYCDIGGQTIAGGTIPPHILVTNKRPDLVIVWEDPKHILLIELTVPFESNITDAHKRKIDRYKALVQDLNETDYDTIYEAIEVGQRGFIDKENKTRIKQILAKCGSNKRPKELVSDLSKAALLCFFFIFYSRHDQAWSDAPYMSI